MARCCFSSLPPEVFGLVVLQPTDANLWGCWFLWALNVKVWFNRARAPSASWPFAILAILTFIVSSSVSGLLWVVIHSSSKCGYTTAWGSGVSGASFSLLTIVSPGQTLELDPTGLGSPPLWMFATVFSALSVYKLSYASCDSQQTISWVIHNSHQQCVVVKITVRLMRSLQL